MKISLKRIQYQTLRARKLKCLEKVRFPPFVPWPVSYVMFNVLHVTCHILNFYFTNWLSLSVEGLLSTGPTPSTFEAHSWITYWWETVIFWWYFEYCYEKGGRVMIGLNKYFDRYSLSATCQPVTCHLITSLSSFSCYKNPRTLGDEAKKGLVSKRVK